MIRKILLTVLLVAASGGCGSDDREEGAQRDRGRASTRDGRPVVLFLGTSLTAGYGLTSERAYPALIQRKIDSAGYGFRVVNAGESGATSAGGVRRIAWLMRQPVEVLVLELGANDGLRGNNPTNTKANLAQIIDSARVLSPGLEILVAAMEAPPNLGGEYTTAFRNIFSELGREKAVRLIPFLLEGVAGVPELSQADGIHPTAQGQSLMAESVWRVLRPVLERLSEGQSAVDPS